MSKIVTILVEVVIFASLIGVISTFIADANVTGVAGILLGLVPMFVVIGFVLAVLKTSGVKTR